MCVPKRAQNYRITSESPKSRRAESYVQRFAAIIESFTLLQGVFLQRLFSTFANGWPGRGLLLQRLVAAAVLFYSAIAHLGQTIPLESTVLRMTGAGAGILLLVGLWTPVIGALVAGLELWIAFTVAANPLTHIMVAALAATLAMIGPGAWSVDARLFGRKRIETPKF